jgi:hypothetical protein
VGEEYLPEQEWTSTDEGASFSAVNGGKSVAEGILSADTGPLNAVIVPGSNALGYAWVTAAGPPTFAEFPLSSPPECSVATGHTCPFATLQPEGEHILSNETGVFASQLGANSGVLGVYETLGKPGCPSGTFDTAYVYGSGSQSSTNNYNISPGTANSAWKFGLSPADCEVEYPAVGGGPSGFGVVEDNLSGHDTVYHPFDEADHSFDTAYVPITGEFEEQASVSQDGSGGVYTTFSDGFEGAIQLAYSPTAGQSWIGPNTLDAAPGESQLTSAVGADGQGWATWSVGESVYAQPFVASDAIPPPAPPAADTLTTSQTSGSSTGPSITITAGVLGETDRATLSGANAGIATGTVTYNLYSKPTCVASSEMFNGGTTAVTGGVAAASAGVSTALAPGTYYWQASYSGDAHDVASSSACGSEVLTVTPAVSIEGSGSSSGTTVTVTVKCPSVEPCTVTVTITATEVTIVVKKASAARRRIVRKRVITLASGKFTIPGKGSKKLKLNLTKAGRRLLKREHGHIKADVHVSDKTAGGLELTTRSITIHTIKPKHRK